MLKLEIQTRDEALILKKLLEIANQNNDIICELIQSKDSQVIEIFEALFEIAKKKNDSELVEFLKSKCNFQ